MNRPRSFLIYLCGVRTHFCIGPDLEGTQEQTTFHVSMDLLGGCFSVTAPSKVKIGPTADCDSLDGAEFTGVEASEGFYRD